MCWAVLENALRLTRRTLAACGNLPVSRRPKRPFRVSPMAAETLETRRLLTVDLTPLEQYFLELVNRARANPAGEAQRYGLSDLNQGLSPGTISATPKAPLAPNQLLLNAARAHSQDMFTRNYFEHTNPEGKSPGDRIAAAGYTFTTWGENIAFYSEGRFRTPSASEMDAERGNPEWAERHHEGLFESPGHRTNLLRDSFRELGPGVTVDPRGTSIVSYATQAFGTRSGNAFVLGVVYLDTTTADQFYTIGEELAGVTITAQSQSGQTFTTTTGAAGGYVLQIPNGTYSITASGGRLTAPVQQGGVTLSGANVKSDFRLASVTPPVNQPPVLAQPAIGMLTVLQQGGGLLFPAATFADADSSTTSGGTVAVSLASAVATDRIVVVNQGTAAGQIGVSGSQITFGGQTLGSFAGGTGTTALTVTLASGATPAGVQALLRSIQYQTTASSPASLAAARVATVTVTDGLSNTAAVNRQVLIAALNPSTGTTRFLRAYNPNADYHFFTRTVAEFHNAVAAGYRDESTGQGGFDVLADYVAGTALIHRLYNLTTGRHYYTLSDGERDSLVRLGWRFEKNEGFMATGTAGNFVEVFRLYNRNSGVHLYTENAAAKDAILAAFPGVWEQHSSLGFATVDVAVVTRSAGSLIVAAATAEPESTPSLFAANVSITLAIAAPSPASAIAFETTILAGDVTITPSTKPLSPPNTAETASLDRLFADDPLAVLLWE
jgi:hypothetical protein